MAVVVEVEKAGGAAPAAGFHSGLGGYIGKRAIPVVVVEGVLSVVRDVEVGKAVVVVIANRDAHAVIAVTRV